MRCLCVQTLAADCSDDFTTSNIDTPGGAGTVSGSTYAFTCGSGFGHATCTDGAWDAPTCLSIDEMPEYDCSERPKSGIYKLMEDCALVTPIDVGDGVQYSSTTRVQY